MSLMEGARCRAVGTGLIHLPREVAEFWRGVDDVDDSPSGPLTQARMVPGLSHQHRLTTEQGNAR